MHVIDLIIPFKNKKMCNFICNLLAQILHDLTCNDDSKSFNKSKEKFTLGPIPFSLSFVLVLQYYNINIYILIKYLIAFQRFNMCYVNKIYFDIK